MTSAIEERVRDALRADAESYTAPSRLWDGVLAGIGRPWWHRSPGRAGAAAAAVLAAAVLAAVVLWPAHGSRVEVGPASGGQDATQMAAPPAPPRGLPAWAYPFLATAKGRPGGLFVVGPDAATRVATERSPGVEDIPVGLAGGAAVYIRSTKGELRSGVLVVHPLHGGRDWTAPVTWASVSPDRNRIAYVTRNGPTPIDLVVRDVRGGHEQRFPLEGSVFSGPWVLFKPVLVADTVVLEYQGGDFGPGHDWPRGTWALDLRTARSAQDATKWPAPDYNVSAYGDTQVVAQTDRHLVLDAATGSVVRALPDGGPQIILADGRGHLVATDFGANESMQVYDGARWLPLTGYGNAAW
jgi:hypothetical protein